MREVEAHNSDLVEISDFIQRHFCFFCSEFFVPDKTCDVVTCSRLQRSSKVHLIKSGDPASSAPRTFVRYQCRTCNHVTAYECQSEKLKSLVETLVDSPSPKEVTAAPSKKDKKKNDLRRILSGSSTKYNDHTLSLADFLQKI